MRNLLPPMLVGIVALSGCGGDSGGNTGDGVQKKDSVTVSANQPIAFGADEYAFEPKNVVVNSGTTGPSVVRFVLRNNGALAHDLHVERDGQDFGGTPIFGPGKTEAGQATLSPGTYEFICTVGDHAQLGMKGTLTVTATKTKRPPDPDAGSAAEKKREQGKDGK